MILTQLSRRAAGSRVSERAQYLTFTVLTGTSEFGWAQRATSGHLEYSLNGGMTWTAIADGESTPTISAGQSVMWRGDLRPAYSTSTTAFSGGIGTFSATGYFKASGNTMSLLFYNDFRGQVSLSGDTWRCAFRELYRENTYITEGGLLPATTLAGYCYRSMFYGCTSLTTAPELPATTLASHCYRSMFNGCTSLTTAPELPATTLAGYCYYSMFRGCTSLTTAPELPATTLAGYCYYYLFYGCTSLTTAPELPATTLASYCYRAMFYGCTSLTYIKCLATDISATDCTYYWLYAAKNTSGCTFVKAAGMEDWTRGSSGIPTNWTVVDDINS